MCESKTYRLNLNHIYRAVQPSTQSILGDFHHPEKKPWAH